MRPLSQAVLQDDHPPQEALAKIGFPPSLTPQGTAPDPI